MTIFIITFIPLNVTAESSQNNDYIIKHVTHVVSIMYNGYILINDTIQVVGQASTDAFLKNFTIGFPREFSPYMIQCFSYNSSHTFQVDLDTPLNGRLGFYGVTINFGKNGLNISNGTTHVFTVIFLLSNNLIKQNVANASSYVVHFPAYPSLTKKVEFFEGWLNLPKGSVYVGGNVALNYSKVNLAAFTYSNASGEVTFTANNDQLMLVDIKELNREMRVGGTGQIEVSDIYHLINKSNVTISSFDVIIPPNASFPKVFDQLGREAPKPKKIGTNRYMVNFTLSAGTGEKAIFKVIYNLPKAYYIKSDGTNFEFTFSIFKELNYFVKEASLTVVLPEGAKIIETENVSKNFYTLSRNVYQQSLAIKSYDIIPFLGNSEVTVKYSYNALWLSFHPTLWVWALAIVGCVVAIVWKRPKAPVSAAVPTVAIRLSSKTLKSFVDSYEKKMKIVKEMESLETRARKGKITRRRYKVRRKTLETRLNTLNKKLSELREKIRAAGGRYNTLMRQLEMAEIELSEAETNIESIRRRHRRGELSMEAYRRLLANYERRRDKAETTIDGVLIRLREEIS